MAARDPMPPDPEAGDPRPRAARADGTLGDGSESAEALVAERERRRADLDDALDAVPQPTLLTSLQRVVDKIPLGLDVELATIRLRASDEPHELHLVAAAGLPADEAARLARRALPVHHARALLALGPNHTLARHLGLLWLNGAWIRGDGEILGIVIVGSRTERRPTAAGLATLETLAERLVQAAHAADRRTRQLRLIGVELASVLLERGPRRADPAAITGLRPRERTVLELYADGLTTREIASVLVISPHTVRTHVKLALRRLGVHSRQEAERLVNEQRVEALL